MKHLRVSLEPRTDGKTISDDLRAWQARPEYPAIMERLRKELTAYYDADIFRRLGIEQL